jgi:hypothetical protein
VIGHWLEVMTRAEKGAIGIIFDIGDVTVLSPPKAMKKTNN